MSHELTHQMLEQWEQAANKQQAPAEAAESFGEFIKSQLGEGTSPTPTGVTASLQDRLNNQEN